MKLVLRLIPSLLAGVLAASAMSAFATEDTSISADCTAIADPTARLVCWDKQADKEVTQARQKREEARAKAAEAKWVIRDRVVTFDQPRLGFPSYGAEAASLSAKQSDGTTVSTIAIGGTWFSRSLDLPATPLWNWKAFAGVQGTRDTASKPETNARKVLAGLTGHIFNHTSDWAELLASLSLHSVSDLTTGTRAYGLSADSTLILQKRWLEQGAPYSEDTYGVFIYPVAGLYLDKRPIVPSGEATGTAKGGHIDVQAEWYPGHRLARIKIFLIVRRALDMTASSGMQRRGSTYQNFGIDYAFLDPYDPQAAEKATVVPSLSLERKLGSYFPDGLAQTAQTILTLKLKVN